MNLFIFSLIIFIILINFFNLSYLKRNKKNNENKIIKENFNNESKLFNNLMENHYNKIFPNDANRNAAGFRFFKYIYDNLATNEELFDIYNKFYCAVSGSIVSPDRDDNYDIVKVNDLDNNCVIGKYYRCCTPCNCDIMKYAVINKASIEIPKGSGKFFDKNLITIGDPCIKEDELPEEIDKNVFKCVNNLLENGYRLNEEGKITENQGRLIIGVLYPINENDNLDLNNSINLCMSGTKRFLSPPDKLKYGMGDIFVKLALINNDKIYHNSKKDLCKEK